MMNQRPGRDNTVEFWRFMFCIAVLGFHFFSKIDSQVMRAGYLGVEFFFILSGYGHACFYQRRMKGYSLCDKITQLGYFIGRRIIRLYPLYAFSLICMLVLRCFQRKWGIADTLQYIKLEWTEFVWLQCGPLGNEVLISSHWYVPAMFWGSVLLLCILILCGKFGGLFLCPIISFGIYSYYFHLIHKIDVIFSYHAVLRGIAGMALGIWIGFLLEIIKSFISDKNIVHNEMLKTILYFGANASLLAVFIYMNFGRRSSWDYAVIGVFSVAVFLLLYVQKNVSDSTAKVFAKLSSLTYPIYILQMPVIELVLMIPIFPIA